jgi:inorganic pyrophosphatase
MTRADWSFWETVIAERGIVINRRRGHPHPSYPEMIYPCDYGHVPRTTAADGHPVDVFFGGGDGGLVGVIRLTHRPSGVRDPKLLVGLGREEAETILVFLDKGEPGPDLRLVWRP